MRANNCLQEQWIGDSLGMICATFVNPSTISVMLADKGNLNGGSLAVTGGFQRYRNVLGMNNNTAQVFFCALSRCETVAIEPGSDGLEHCRLNFRG